MEKVPVLRLGFQPRNVKQRGKLLNEGIFMGSAPIQGSPSLESYDKSKFSNFQGVREITVMSHFCTEYFMVQKREAVHSSSKDGSGTGRRNG
jgi:hypothetical protein